ncbi:MAG: chemotaxis protein CheW [Alphaproteobacteria bacterium]|nr:chemotaxis protein CheW [Alphaproteobacteria bacterium]
MEAALDFASNDVGNLGNPDAVEVTASASQFVTFTCGDKSYGIDIMAVREIRSGSTTTELPNQPYGAKGVLDIRGSIIQVYDLASMLGIGGGFNEGGTSQVVLVVSLPGSDVGLLVDAVSDIIFAEGADFQPVPRGGSGRGEVVGGLVRNEDRLIAILNLAALFPDD